MSSQTAPLDDPNSPESIESRKQAASELRMAKKMARNMRDRLLSDSSDEVPRGILKNARFPTKRSVSECVDDLSQIMADLDLNIHDFSPKLCSHHSSSRFAEEDEEDYDEEEDDEEGDGEGPTDSENRTIGRRSKKCDCYNKLSDTDCNKKPKKSVHFDEQVYETVYIASRLYDRRSFVKYHFSSRHHPTANNGNKSKKNHKQNINLSKSETKCDQTKSTKSDTSNGCKQSKSQRSKQSKKDKKRRLNRRDDANSTDSTSSDDQGYSSIQSLSD